MKKLRVIKAVLLSRDKMRIYKITYSKARRSLSVSSLCSPFLSRNKGFQTYRLNFA